jgi:hypothetical protein
MEFKIIEDKILKSYTDYVYTNLCSDDKDYNTNLNKKLVYLSKSLLESIFRKKESTSEQMMQNAYLSLLKRGAHYLRLDSLQVIRELIDEGSIERMSFDQIGGIDSINFSVYR